MLPLASRHQRRNTPHRDATVGAFGTGRLDLEILLAIALRDHVFRRHAELLASAPGHGLGAAIGGD